MHPRDPPEQMVGVSGPVHIHRGLESYPRTPTLCPPTRLGPDAPPWARCWSHHGGMPGWWAAVSGSRGLAGNGGEAGTVENEGAGLSLGGVRPSAPGLGQGLGPGPGFALSGPCLERKHLLRTTLQNFPPLPLRPKPIGGQGPLLPLRALSIPRSSARSECPSPAISRVCCLETAAALPGLLNNRHTCVWEDPAPMRVGPGGCRRRGAGARE